MQYPGNPREVATFHCNICGQTNEYEGSGFHREGASCHRCGSVARFRGIVNAISEAIFDDRIRLNDFPVRKDLKAIGMSDSPIYAAGLEQAFSYINTFYHQEPFFDVTGGGEPKYCDLDFLICSEVLEHVSSPVSRSVVNIHRALRPGGKLIFSVPYSAALTTQEHYGEHESVVKSVEFSAGEWIVLQKNGPADWKVHEKPIFHGGPGTTLEMRIFAAPHVVSLLSNAGFKQIRIYDKPLLDIGYYWPPLKERFDILEPILGYVIAAVA